MLSAKSPRAQVDGLARIGLFSVYAGACGRAIADVGGHVAETAVKQLKTSARQVVSDGLRGAARAKILLERNRATPTARRLLDVIVRCLKENFTAADHDWFRRVEEQRRTMLDSPATVTKVDFGAGTSDDQLSEADMSAGVVKQTTVADVCRLTSKRPWWGRILYALIAEYQPKNALELGTSVGVSAEYQGGALQRYGGHLVTMEGAPEIAAIAQTAIDSLGLGEVIDIMVGRFGDALPSFLESADPLDFVFIDGHHDENATQEYHRLIKPHLAPGAVLVYDDIHWSHGMERAWAAISADPDLCVTVDLTAVGVAILGSDVKKAYRYPLRGTG